VHFILTILFMATLAAPFGDVEGSAVGLDSGVTVEMTVKVTQTFEAVLVRPFSSFEELPPTALVFRDDGTWEGLVRFPTATDWSFVFDGIAAGGVVTRSDAITLTEIGVDPVVVGGVPERPAARTLSTTTLWLIAAFVFAVSALGALGYWTFASRSDST